MEIRYDLSFLKEYAKIFGRDNNWLADKFHCGAKFVDKILNGEYKVKKEQLEEIMYEFGYNNYDKFKTEIISQTNERKRNIQVRDIFSPIKYDFNNMNNCDRIIISMLCENKNVSIENAMDFLGLENYDVKKAIKNNILTKNRSFITNEQEKIKIRENVNCNTPTNEIFDYNLMSNKDRIIVSLLCDDMLIYSIKQISNFTNYDEEYIKKIFKTVSSNIDYVSKLDKNFQKTKA